MTCVNTVLFSAEPGSEPGCGLPSFRENASGPGGCMCRHPFSPLFRVHRGPLPSPSPGLLRAGGGQCARSLLHSLLTSRERRALTLFLRMAFQQKNYRCRLGRLRPVPLFRTDNRESRVVSGVVLPRGCVGFCHDEQFYHPWVWDCKSRSTS